MIESKGQKHFACQNLKALLKNSLLKTFIHYYGALNIYILQAFVILYKQVMVSHILQYTWAMWLIKLCMLQMVHPHNFHKEITSLQLLETLFKFTFLAFSKILSKQILHNVYLSIFADFILKSKGAVHFKLHDLIEKLRWKCCSVQTSFWVEVCQVPIKGGSEVPPIYMETHESCIWM